MQSKRDNTVTIRVQPFVCSHKGRELLRIPSVVVPGRCQACMDWSTSCSAPPARQQKQDQRQHLGLLYLQTHCLRGAVDQRDGLATCGMISSAHSPVEKLPFPQLNRVVVAAAPPGQQNRGRLKILFSTWFSQSMASASMMTSATTRWSLGTGPTVA